MCVSLNIYIYVACKNSTKLKKETGRIEKGEKSDQKMKKVDFEPDHIFHNKIFKLYPFSTMDVKKKAI